MARLKPKTQVKRPVFSWSSGKEVVDRDTIYRGWFIDVGLDDALDGAAAAAGWPAGTMRHLDGQQRQHWLLPTPCPFFVLIQGVPYTSMGAMVRDDVSFSGVGCRWQEGERSRLGVLVLHPDLVTQGYLEPLAAVVSSTSTDDLLVALLRHNALLDAAEAAAAARGNQREFEFWEFACPLAAGHQVARGREQTTSISPIICTHPKEPDRTYLREVWGPKVVASVVAERWTEITTWAAAFARGGRGGERVAEREDGRDD